MTLLLKTFQTIEREPILSILRGICACRNFINVYASSWKQLFENLIVLRSLILNLKFSWLHYVLDDEKNRIFHCKSKEVDQHIPEYQDDDFQNLKQALTVSNYFTCKKISVEKFQRLSWRISVKALRNWKISVKALLKWLQKLTIRIRMKRLIEIIIVSFDYNEQL